MNLFIFNLKTNWFDNTVILINSVLFHLTQICNSTISFDISSIQMQINIHNILDYKLNMTFFLISIFGLIIIMKYLLVYRQLVCIQTVQPTKQLLKSGRICTMALKYYIYVWFSGQEVECFLEISECLLSSCLSAVSIILFLYILCDVSK